MANKDKTLEQLYEEAIQAQKAYEAAKKLDEQKKQEEVERKRAELELAKEKRIAEIEETASKLETLLTAYNKDYGVYKSRNTALPYWLYWFL